MNSPMSKITLNGFCLAASSVSREQVRKLRSRLRHGYGGQGPIRTNHSRKSAARPSLDQGGTGTLQKMIVQSGSVTMQLDLNRLNGIATPCIGQYVFQQIGDSIVPGTTDSGNHGDNQVTNIPLPFSYTLYDQTFNSINVSSNGNAQFTTTDTAFTNVCPLPWTSHNYTIFLYWDDQRTDANSGCSAFPGGNCGVFTSVSGTAPNRIFNIEWRTVYFADPTTTANYELRLYEGGQSRFDVIYGRGG